MSIGRTSLPFEEIIIYTISRATKTRPFKAVIGEVEPGKNLCLFFKEIKSWPLGKRLVPAYMVSSLLTEKGFTWKSRLNSRYVAVSPQLTLQSFACKMLCLTSFAPFVQILDKGTQVRNTQVLSQRQELVIHIWNKPLPFWTPK